jgi:hypothetical protein
MHVPDIQASVGYSRLGAFLGLLLELSMEFNKPIVIT